MNKIGRPTVMTYEQFVETWQQLIEEGRARVNTVQEILGGSKSTIADFRERYEREEASKKISFIKYIKLDEAICKAIAEIKSEEMVQLEQNNQQLLARLDENLQHLKKAEDKFTAAQTDFDEGQIAFEAQEKEFNCKLAATEALRMQAEDRERKLIKHNEELREQLNQAKQEAAVAKKEIDMLREQQKKKN